MFVENSTVYAEFNMIDMKVKREGRINQNVSGTSGIFQKYSRNNESLTHLKNLILRNNAVTVSNM